MEKIRRLRMSTSDGIDTKDWDTVHQLSLNIVNSGEDESNQYTDQLLNFLESLEKKYGELPSILATRADYIEDMIQREKLYIRAYTLAEKRNDNQNCLETAHSLSELYIEDFKDAKKGNRWMGVFRRYLNKGDDPVSEELCELLHEELEKLKANKVPGE